MLRMKSLSFLLIPLMLGCANVHADTNILIVGEEYGRNTVLQSHPIFTRVLNVVSDLLNTEGYNVFDETSVTMDTYVKGKGKRSDAELIHMARGITQPPIKVLVMLRIEARVKPPKYGSAGLRITVQGRLLNIGTGQRVGSYEYTAPKAWRITPDCAKDRDCVLEEVGDKIKIIGEDVGAILENKLSAMVGPSEKSNALSGTGAVSSSGTQCIPNAYELTVSGFKSAEYRSIENDMVEFKGYKKHIVSSSGKRRIVYWYESCIESARLNRNFAKMFELMDVKSHVSFSGNKFEIRKIRVRR